MNQDDVVRLARQAARQPDRVYAPDEKEFLYYFAKLVEDKKQAEIETLYALYKQACEQRDALMDQQRAQIEAMRGRIQ